IGPLGSPNVLPSITQHFLYSNSHLHFTTDLSSFLSIPKALYKLSLIKPLYCETSTMAQGENGTPIKRRFWLITSPRTASNMLVKILNLDEQGVRPGPMAGGYFFLPAAVERLTRL